LCTSVRTWLCTSACMPTVVSAVTLSNATDADVAAVVAAAGAAAKAWRALSFDARVRCPLRAADLLAGPWRPGLNAATIPGSQAVFQDEIDGGCEMIDFWRLIDDDDRHQ